MKELTPEQYHALLNQCGLTVESLATQKLSIVRPTFIVKHGDLPLGQVYCHNSRTIPVNEVILYNIHFIEEMQRIIGIRSSEVISIRNRLLTMNYRLRGLADASPEDSVDHPEE